MSELTRSSFWTKYRVLVATLALSVLLALVAGCGGGGGGGNGGGGGGGSVPAAPTGLVATAGNTQVLLTWNSVSGATSYRVKRSVSNGGPYATIISFLSTTNFTDTGRTNGTTYYYVVSAVNAIGEGGNSNQASATPNDGGGGGGGGGSWLPANKIFYTATDGLDPTVTDIRKIDPTGLNDVLFQSAAQQFQAVTPNPNVTNQLVFARTASPNPGSDPNATYALYRNTSVSLAGAVKLTDEITNPFTQIGTIQFTPDGQKILFTGALGSDHALYSLNTDGTNLTRLTSADDANLSPDGTTVVFSQLQGDEADLFTMTLAGNVVSPLTGATTDVDEIMPQWSKDGNMVTFSSKAVAVPTDPYNVFVMTVGSPDAPVQITASGDSNFSPSFSPDDSQIAYARISFSDPGLSGVYVAPVTPGSETNVILNSSVGTSVYWTSSTGRAQGAMSMSLGRSLRFNKLGR